MSGFDLVPVDGDGGDPIHLPPGETALGRGPLLGVSDKRVSRHHGVLENLNGQLRLKPTHLNPCFVQSSLTDDPQPLQRGAWHFLHHGDLFSLLPGQFIYRVVAVAGEDITPRNSQRFEEEEEVPVSTNPDAPDQGQTPPPEDRGQTPPPETSNQEEADRRLNEKVSEVDDEQSNVAPPATRRRVLPAWMMAAAAAVYGSPSGLRAESAAKRRKTPAAASTSTKRAAAAAQTKTASPEEAELSEEGMPKKRRRKICEEEKAQTKEAPSVRLQRESHRSEVSNESGGFTMELDDEGRGGETSVDDVDATSQPNAVSKPESKDRKLENGRRTTKRAESAGSDSGSASRPTPSKPRVRTPCPYGKDCYRKNPIHFQECSHPGDTDYEEEEETEEGDRPECPYGTDCYRKNPLHRKEYKHTKKPASSTRTLRRKPPANEDDDEDDDLGDDDSFINDDSEDVGDDSDYAPPDSDDSGKEDVNRLQKEAKAFLRRK